MKSKNSFKKLDSNLYLILLNFVILVYTFLKSSNIESYIFVIIPIIILNLVLLEYKSKKYKYNKICSCYIFEESANLVFINCMQIYLIAFASFIYLFLTNSLNLNALIIFMFICIFNLYYMKKRRKKYV